MKGKEFFSKLSFAPYSFTLLPEIDNYFKAISSSLGEIEIIDSLIETEKDANGLGTAGRILLIESKLLHQIDISIKTIKYNVHQLKNINSICIEGENDRDHFKQKEANTIDKLKLIITICGSDQNIKSLDSDFRFFADYNRIKDSLLNLIRK